MLTEDKAIEIFVMADEFCKVLNTMLRRRGLDTPKERKKRDYHRDCRMSQAEIIVILIMFHCSNHKCLKHFYLNEICVRFHATSCQKMIIQELFVSSTHALGG